jgi:hypothetical protein
MAPWRTLFRSKPFIGKNFLDFAGWARNYDWWRRGELNPRPRVFHLRDYMLSRCFSVTL